MVGKLESSLRLAGIFAPLTVLDYRRLVLCNALWWQVLFMEMIVVGWLVLDMTDSTWSVAVIGFFRSAPLMLGGFLIGPVSERIRRRTLVVITQTVYLCMYGLVALLLVTGFLALWHLAIISFILGLAWALDFPTRRALIPDFVGKEHTMDALLLESFASGITRVIGPFFAGWLIAAAGAVGCFTVIAMISAIALAILHPITKSDISRTAEPNGSAWRTIVEGFRYVRQQQTLLAVVLITFVMNLFIFPYITLLPTFARDILQQGPEGLGFLGTGTGIGAFIGLFVIHRTRHRVQPGKIYAVGTFCQCLGLIAFAASTIYALSWGLLFFAGIGQACFAVLQSAIILLTASDEMRSRAMGAVMIGIGADPLGKLLMGSLAEGYGAPFALGLQASLAAILVAGVALLWPQLWRTEANPVDD